MGKSLTLIFTVDIHQLDGFFNWTMTYRRDSDFYLPYGRFRQVRHQRIYLFLGEEDHNTAGDNCIKLYYSVN